MVTRHERCVALNYLAVLFNLSLYEPLLHRSVSSLGREIQHAQNNKEHGKASHVSRVEPNAKSYENIEANSRDQRIFPTDDVSIRLDAMLHVIH